MKVLIYSISVEVEEGMKDDSSFRRHNLSILEDCLMRQDYSLYDSSVEEEDY